MVRKKSSEMREKIHSIHEENEFKSIMDNRNRSRSITVGTAFGGTIEIVMRNEFHVLYTLLQPVEAVEIMEQIAAGCGIEIAMRPKQNFTSWRGWSIDDNNPDCYMKGSAPWQLEGQEFSKKLQAVREDMQLEIEKARIQVQLEKELKKIKSSTKKNTNLLPEASEETPKKVRSVRKKSPKKATTEVKESIEENE
jgi:hypothetical protein